MTIESACQWISRSARRPLVLLWLHQPMTAKQLGGLTGLSSAACGQVLWELSVCKLVRCLNPAARRSRVYGLTGSGGSCRKRLRRNMGLRVGEYRSPDVDWSLYGWTLFSHRSLVIQTMHEPMQPATLRRRVVAQRPGARISANNVRDVIKELCARGVVRKIVPRKRGHARYVLTPVGEVLQSLMVHAEPLHPENFDVGGRLRREVGVRLDAARALIPARVVRGVVGGRP